MALRPQKGAVGALKRATSLVALFGITAAIIVSHAQANKADEWETYEAPPVGPVAGPVMSELDRLPPLPMNVTLNEPSAIPDAVVEEEKAPVDPLDIKDIVSDPTNNPELIKKCADFIIQFEGFSEVPYLCAAGFPTIGFGERIQGLEGLSKKEQEKLLASMRTTKEEAYEHLVKKVESCVQSVDESVKGSMSVGMVIALSSLSYNCGETAIAESQVIKCVNKGQSEKAIQELMEWNNITVVGKDGKPHLVANEGLTRRRQEEASIFLQSLPNGADRPTVVASATPAPKLQR